MREISRSGIRSERFDGKSGVQFTTCNLTQGPSTGREVFYAYLRLCLTSYVIPIIFGGRRNEGSRE